MRAIRIVFAKEVLENLRDRRVILSAFFFGVLLAPVIFGSPRRWRRSAWCANQDKPLRLPVVGQRARAEPGALPRRERRRGRRRSQLTPDEAMDAVRSGQQDLVLLIGERLRREAAGRRARAARSGRRHVEQPDRARAPIARGGCSKRTAVSWRRCACWCAASVPEVIEPVDVRTLDVATPAGRSLLILGMMTYFCFMSMLVGGFYLAIDTTAGERERGSLEPLLSLPVTARRADRRQDARDRRRSCRSRCC